MNAIINQNQPLNTDAMLSALDKIDIQTAEEVSGVNPPKFNLKDHPEANGKKCLVLGGTFKESTYEQGSPMYFIGTALVYPADIDIKSIKPEDRRAYLVTLMTGAENVVTRIFDASSKGAFPVVGTLRAEGDAWFYD